MPHLIEVGSHFIKRPDFEIKLVGTMFVYPVLELAHAFKGSIIVSGHRKDLLELFDNAVEGGC